MKATIPSPSTATVCSLWTYNSGTSPERCGEYWNEINGAQHISPLLYKIYFEMTFSRRNKDNYWKRGLKKAASQFLVNNN